MPQVIEPPTRTLPSLLLPRLRWKAEQYENLFAMGLLPNGTFELIEGDVIEKMPIKDAHSQIITLLFILLSAFVAPQRLRSQFTLWIDSENLPEPDFAVLTTPNPTLTERGYQQPANIALLIEVSDATLNQDLTVKARLYAGANIPEYWVIDVTGRRLLIHTLPGQDGYTHVTEYMESDTASISLAANSTFTVPQIMPV